MKNATKNQWIQFGIFGTLYLLWVIWLGNYWWLIGMGIIFDLYITQKVNWTFWKKMNPPDGKQTKTAEWTDALIFAIFAATFIRLFFIEAYTIPTSSMEKSMMVGDYLFVSKTAYGPKIPNTPVAFPFVHHTMPFTESTPSFSTVIQNDYRRIAGFGKVKNDDVVVFNFPEGDTVASRMQDRSYYELIRSYGRNRVINDKATYGDILYRPVDKRENYIKRCIAIPGDSLKIVAGQVFINGKPQKEIPGIQGKYLVTIQGSTLSSSSMEKIGVSPEDIEGNGSRLILNLTNEQFKRLDEFKFILSKEKISWPKEEYDSNIFPCNEQYRWNLDNFGPIWVPKKGATINLTTQNLPLYQRIIDVYEENDLKVVGNEIFINGKSVTQYTFKMDYFWMMGDNRYNSADSRYWGFVPEDHIVGKASLVWLSLDKNKSFPANIRWSRIFMGIK